MKTANDDEKSLCLFLLDEQMIYQIFFKNSIYTMGQLYNGVSTILQQKSKLKIIALLSTSTL